MRITNKWLKVLFSTLLFSSITAQADIAVIVNSANQGVSLTRSEVQAIFLGIKSQLPNGTPIVPFDEGSDSSLRETFYKLVAGKNSVEMKAYWLRLNFTGRGTPPVTLPTPSAVLAKVSSDKNAISYVDASLAKGASVSVAFLIPTR